MSQSSHPHLSGHELRSYARECLRQTEILSQGLKSGDINKVKKALDKGALPEKIEFPGALGEALKHKNVELLEILLKAGAPVISFADDDFFLDKTSLNQMAIQEKFPEAIAFLKITPSPSDVLAALKAKDLLALKYLDALKWTSRKESLGYHNVPILFYAISPEIVEYLVQTGADVNFKAEGKKDLNAMNWYINHLDLYRDDNDLSLQSSRWPKNPNPTPIVEKWIELGAKVTEKTLVNACERGYPDLIRLIASHLPHKIWGKNLKGEESHLKNANPQFLIELLEEQKIKDEKKALHQSLPLENTTTTRKPKI